MVRPIDNIRGIDTAAGLVDDQLGEVYKTVELVAKHIAELKFIAANMNSVMDAKAVINLQAKFADLQNSFNTITQTVDGLGADVTGVKQLQETLRQLLETMDQAVKALQAKPDVPQSVIDEMAAIRKIAEEALGQGHNKGDLVVPGAVISNPTAVVDETALPATRIASQSGSNTVYLYRLASTGGIGFTANGGTSFGNFITVDFNINGSVNNLYIGAKTLGTLFHHSGITGTVYIPNVVDLRGDTNMDFGVTNANFFETVSKDTGGMRIDVNGIKDLTRATGDNTHGSLTGKYVMQFSREADGHTYQVDTDMVWYFRGDVRLSAPAMDDDSNRAVSSAWVRKHVTASLPSKKIWVGTDADYAALAPKDDGTLYFTY